MRWDFLFQSLWGGASSFSLYGAGLPDLSSTGARLRLYKWAGLPTLNSYNCRTSCFSLYRSGTYFGHVREQGFLLWSLKGRDFLRALTVAGLPVVVSRGAGLPLAI